MLEPKQGTNGLGWLGSSGTWVVEKKEGGVWLEMPMYRYVVCTDGVKTGSETPTGCCEYACVALSTCYAARAVSSIS